LVENSFEPAFAYMIEQGAKLGMKPQPDAL